MAGELKKVRWAEAGYADNTFLVARHGDSRVIAFQRVYPNFPNSRQLGLYSMSDYEAKRHAGAFRASLSGVSDPLMMAPDDPLCRIAVSVHAHPDGSFDYRINIPGLTEPQAGAIPRKQLEELAQALA